MKTTCKTVCIFLCSVALLTPLTTFAQDQHPVLQAKLNSIFKRTFFNHDATEIATPGSILVLHKDGLELVSAAARAPLTNTYKGGKISRGDFKWTMEMSLLQSDLPPAQVPKKIFDSGDKIWLLAATAEKNGITLKVASDAYADIRYWGQITVPYEKGKPDMEAFDRLVEVVNVDSPNETAAVPAPGSSAANAAAAAVSDPKEILKRTLASAIVLTQGDTTTGEITTPGSTAAFKRDGMVLWTIEDQVPPNYTYKDGKISLHLMDWGRANQVLQTRDGNLTPSTIPKHPLRPCEKVWIMNIRVRDNGVLLSFMSDAYDNVRYIGDLWFPFDKKTIPSSAELTRTLAEVLTIDPPAGETQTASADSEPAAAPAAPPAAPPAPMAAIPPPPAPPAEVTVGQSKQQVEAILGAPQKKATLGAKEIFYYPNKKLIFIDGKVKYIQ